MTTHSEREAFEAAMQETYGWAKSIFRLDGSLTRYVEPSAIGAWQAWELARTTPPHPAEVGEAVAYEVISHFDSGAYGTKMPIIGVKDGEHIPIGTKLYSAQGLHVYAAPAAVDVTDELVEMACLAAVEMDDGAKATGYDRTYGGEHSRNAFRKGMRAGLNAVRTSLATANSAEGKVVPDELSTADAGFAGADERERGYVEGWNACREAMLNATASTSRGS